MRLFTRQLVVLLMLIFATATAMAKALDGVVSHVTDGDTLWLRPASGPPVQVRLQGLDAPEICQPFGRQARQALAARVLHRTVRISVRARDKYHRSVGTLSLEGEDVGAWLVAGGFAWSARYRGRDGPYARQELSARQGRIGLWAGHAVEPRVFRQRHGSCRPG